KPPAEVVALRPLGDDGILAEPRRLVAAGRVPRQLSEPQRGDEVVLPVVGAARHEPQPAAGGQPVQPLLAGVERERTFREERRPVGTPGVAVPLHEEDAGCHGCTCWLILGASITRRGAPPRWNPDPTRPAPP